jgi:rhodanese-related sulfurtransferase
MSRKSIEELLQEARQGLERPGPEQARAAIDAGATLVDIRADSQIAADGKVPGAMVIARNVLEWRLDPDCPHRHPQAPGLREQVIVMCHEGYASSLVAATLREMGFARATDLDGGFQAWRAAGLPVEPPAGRPEGRTR